MRPLLALTRPKQWVKSLFVLAPVVFAQQTGREPMLSLALIACGAFTLASIISYIVNDLRDIDADRLHAQKRYRPLAAGTVSIHAARLLIVALLIPLLGLVSLLPLASTLVILGYFVLMLCYSQWLKHIAIVDVMMIAVGFVLRLLAGGYATGIEVSPWMIQVTFLLSLFLGFGKRYNEITSDTGRTTRKSLSGYSAALLDRLLAISCGATLLAYAMYAVDTSARLHRTGFVYSSLFVAFGLFRYLQQLTLNRRGEAPEEALFHDRLFLANLMAWLAFCLWQIGAAAR